MSPVERTLKYLKECEHEAWIVERYIYQKRIKIDLFNIIDAISLHPVDGLIGWQVCGPDYAAHYRKIVSSKYSKLWLETGAKLTLISWRKLLKKRGGKQYIYTPRIHEFNLTDLKEKD